MGCSRKLLFDRQRLSFVAISSLLLLISSSTHLRFMAEGRPPPKPASFSQTVNENKRIVRSQIGSRPPSCQKRCSSCDHCEAIQVPTNPQVNVGHGGNHSTEAAANVAYVRGDDSSNYKPMSWKCKCGNLIFNP